MNCMVLVVVHMENETSDVQPMPGTTSTALPSFSHDKHHKNRCGQTEGGPLTTGAFLNTVVNTVQYESYSAEIPVLLFVALTSSVGTGRRAVGWGRQQWLK